MINFKEVLQKAEGHSKVLVAAAFFFLAILIIAQSIFSPLTIIFALLAILFTIFSIARPKWILTFIAIYLPFESVILKYTPDDVCLFARYFPELLIYFLVAVVLFRFLSAKTSLQRTPIDLPFILFLIVLVSSAIINTVSPTVAILGARQILRFILVFFLVVYLKPSKTYIKKLTTILFVIIIIQSSLGLLQSVVGAPMDTFLLPSETRVAGDITLSAGVQQFWDPGSRIFSTLGRYDRLGNFLYFFLLIATGFLYEKRLRKNRGRLWLIFGVGLPALLLTFSRSSWFAFLLGFLFIGLLIKRDKRVLIALVTFVIVVSSYLALSGLQVRYMAESPGQTLVERFYESFSSARWRGEYYGLGRMYWMVQTPLRVIPESPLFGFGPGQYGGGAAAALQNTIVYDKLGLPFGVFGTEGSIDNSWFSLWGESGTLGMIMYLWMYLTLFKYAIQTYKKSNESYVRAISIGFAAILIAVAFNALTSTVLEIRTLAFYLWLYAGFLFVLGERVKQE